MSKRSLFLDSAREHGSPLGTGAGFAPAPTIEQLLGLPPVKPPSNGKPYLDNRFGICELGALVPVEAAVTAATIPEALRRLRNRTSWGLKELRLVHATIFRPIYPWAGKVRESDISKDGTIFETHDLIPRRMGQLIDKLERVYAGGERLIDGLQKKSQTGVADTLAQLYHGICWIHPFREGNGRTMRTFTQAIARQVGYDLHWNKLDRLAKDRFDKACALPVNFSDSPLTPFFRSIITPMNDAPAPPLLHHTAVAPAGLTRS